ncbi:MAG: hypothetical protein F6J98_02065 [Moorea sp. SIO4G2]|nr:hypothetical protein [Moorena sp. SIO4G2]
MPTVLRQQLVSITIGQTLILQTGDRSLLSWSASISDQDRSSQCVVEMFDQDSAVANLFLTQFQAAGGIFTPEGLLRAVQKDISSTGGSASPAAVSGRPTGDDLAKILIQECRKNGVTSKPQIAYVLATAQHESNMGKLMVELASGRAYEGRKDLGNVRKGDGVLFKGRGYVQITGRTNYAKWEKILGVPLVSKPDLAADPRYAAPVLVLGMKNGSFTGVSLNTYIREGKTDFLNARRIVNQMDKASLIAGYAKTWLAKIDTLSRSNNVVSKPVPPQSLVSKPGNINEEEGIKIYYDIGFNDRSSVRLEYYLTGIRTTENDVTRFTGKQIKSIVGGGKKLFAATHNTSIRQLAKRIKMDTGVDISLSGNVSRVRQVVQENETVYQSLVRLAQEEGLVVKGDVKTLKITPLSSSDRSFTVRREHLLSGSTWGDEAVTNRVLKGSLKTDTNLPSSQQIIDEGVLDIQSVPSEDEGIGRGFEGQLVIDIHRTPGIIELTPGDFIQVAGTLGSMARKYRVSDVRHTSGQSTIDIYLPVRIARTKKKTLAGSQPGVSTQDGQLNLSSSDRLSLKRGQNVAGYTVTSPFGYRTDPKTGTKRMHRGVDIGTPIGVKIYPVVKPGETVKIKTFFDNRGGGKVVRWNYGGFTFQVLHCSVTGNPEKSYGFGEAIARTGNTTGLVNRTTGPHAHVEQWRTDDPDKKRINPYRGFVRIMLTGKM